MFLAPIIIVNVTVDVVLDVTIAKLLPNENKKKKKDNSLYVWSMMFLYIQHIVIIANEEVERTSEQLTSF